MRIPIAREGWAFIGPAAAAACLLALTGRWRTASPFAVAAAACAGFFRDPERRVPQSPDALVAPADGKVMEIAQIDDGWVGAATRVSVFLSPLDVHVNRAPMAGLVHSVEYTRGGYAPAYRAEASEGNERCEVRIEGDRARVAVRQIAGVVARRIVCRVRPGDKLEAGERFGLIRFGSRTDLILPRDAVLRVEVGDRVWGGETIMAWLR